MALLGLLLACGSSPGEPDAPDLPAVPALESVPFALLGSGKVAFERIGANGAYSTVYVIDGTAMRSMHTLDNSPMFGPALSPDGRRLAYAKYTDGATLYDVYVANVDGTGVERVRGSRAGWPPTWSPNGTKTVVAATSGDGVGFNFYSQSPVANAADTKRLTDFRVGPGGTIQI